MSEEGWRQAMELFERAAQLPADARESFVSEQARAAPQLRTRVLAMLRADQAPHRLLDAAGGILAAVPTETGRSLEGRQIGPYAVVQEIGRGGMAAVYLATDLRHRRAVALKLLEAEASTARVGERFRREIELVARLQHPNILPLYDSGEIDGRPYYVMPLAREGSLRDRIAARGALPVDDVIRITRDVATALDYAHRRGVVHRDVTPANILLDEEHVCIADFGIAQRLTPDAEGAVTLPGVAVGTPAYMSPEQAAAAGEVGGRSDLYALGCVVYQMLTGSPPFRAHSAPQMLALHANAPVPSARRLRPELNAAVDDVLGQVLAKEPERRFGSAREFALALEAALVPASSPPNAPARAPRRRVVAAVVAGLIGTAAALGAWHAMAASAPPSVVVLPFANVSGNRADEYLSDGVTEELTGALAELGRLRVTPRTTAFGYKGRTGDLRRIGAELGATRIVEGSVRRDGDRVLVLASLYDAATGQRLWSGRFERGWQAVLTLQGEIAGAIAAQLRHTLLPGEARRLADRHTLDAVAYDSYLRGRHFFNLRTATSLEQAIGHFRKALERDSLYARAWAGLADSYSILAWTGGAEPKALFPEAERAAREALRLDPSLAEAHVSIAIIRTFHDWDWAAADSATRRALALDAGSAMTWSFRAWHLVAAGRYVEGLAAIERARQLEPLSLIHCARNATMLAWLGRYEAADSLLVRALEIDPSYPVARVQRARVLSLLGRHEEAVAALPPDSVRFGGFEAGIRGFVLARAGRRDAARDAAESLAARGTVPAEAVAAVYAALGDRDLALTWLERAVAARGPGLIFLEAEPMYASLRSEPRYQRVVARVGLGR